MLSNFVDHMDGELARLSGKSSRFGYHYDNYSDAFIHVALFFCIGYGLQDSWIGDWAPYLGLIAGGLRLGALPHILANRAACGHAPGTAADVQGDPPGGRDVFHWSHHLGRAA